MIAVALAAVLATAPQTLTLDQVLRQAQERNADLAVARERLVQTRELARKALAGYLPQLAAGGTYTFNSAEAKISLPTGYYVRDVMQPQGPPFDPAQEPSLENPPGLQTSYLLFPSGVAEAVIQPKHQLAGQVQLTQGLVIPALWYAIANAGRAEEVAALSVESARREVLFGATQLYYGAVGLKDAAAVQERLLETNVEHEKDAKVRFDHGSAPKIAWLRAQIERARSEQDVKRTRIAYESAKSALAALIDRSPDFEVVRPAAPPSPADAAPRPLDDRPDLRAAAKALELAEASRSGAIAQYAPTLALFARYQAVNAKGFTGEYGSFVAGVSFSWTLWDGGQRESALREAASKIVEAQHALRGAKVKAEDEQRRALLDLESARANRVKAEEQLKLAQENAGLVKASFDAGAATYLEVLDANSALVGAELARLSETLSADLAVLKLLKAQGAFDPVAITEEGR